MTSSDPHTSPEQVARLLAFVDAAIERQFDGHQRQQLRNAHAHGVMPDVKTVIFPEWGGEPPYVRSMMLEIYINVPSVGPVYVDVADPRRDLGHTEEMILRDAWAVCAENDIAMPSAPDDISGIEDSPSD